ncbi:hypothetical protein CC80DRAFT_507910 [Byssothecium circinans]|uniref:Uncharacterized protein n=1 Tax=Byssothecium circinans TaxID=147558 RepID=A0A6A5TKI6_9PLEO|nr:hypothetical protein CC80DRAFT_507910 [Byssothecium circinans]
MDSACNNQHTMENAATLRRDEHTLVLPPPAYGSRSVSPRTILPRPTNESSSAPVHGGYVPGSIEVYCFNFISKVIAVFGDPSDEWTTIQEALIRFKSGQLSKRQAHLTMSTVVNTRGELQQALLDVLDHPDAQWGVGDFDISAPPTSHTSPAFLEPQYEPQLPMLVTPNRYSAQHTPQSQPLIPYQLDATRQQQQIRQMNGLSELNSSGMFDTPVNSFNDQNGYLNQGDPAQNQWPYVNWNPFMPNGLSSPLPPMPSELPLNHHHASQALHTGFSPSFDSQGYQDPAQIERPRTSDTAWQGHVVGVNWAGGFYTPNWSVTPQQHQQMLEMARRHQQGLSTPVFETDAVSHSASAHASSTPLRLGTPIAVPLGQPTYEMAPMRRPSEEGTPANHRGGSEEDMDALAPEVSLPAKTKRKSRASEIAADQGKTRASPNSGQFIHAICGRSFQTRYSVKKHHWGGVSEEAHTASSCWAKNGKPDRAWDEHPSCQKGEQPRKTKSRRSSTKADPAIRKPTIDPAPEPQVPSKFKAPTAPSMISQPEIPALGVPDLSDSPNAVAKIVLGVSFGSLTAVNAVSKVDAPRPQGRNDSIVSHLDAQVSAAEREEQGYIPAANGDGLGHEYQVSADQQPFEAQVPHNMILSSQVQEAHTVGPKPTIQASGTDMAPINDIQLDSPRLVENKGKKSRAGKRGLDHVRSAASKNELGALGLSVSPGPARKRAKIEL